MFFIAAKAMSLVSEAQKRSLELEVSWQRPLGMVMARQVAGDSCSRSHEKKRMHVTNSGGIADEHGICRDI